ncbi:MAG: MlaD family protein [Thermodesulfobacteriota bacterium]|jgi:paraquat-inducible protein B|nr:MAG: MlaD family protein [Thermodesulfobacteriota bacterium]
MSKKASKTLIGAFVVGALVLAVIGILLFGSGQFFSESKTYVLFFRGSVKGLNVGAPVSFRGVKVGQVTDIKARIDPRDYALSIAVYIKTNPGWLTPVAEEKTLDMILSSFERGKILQDLVTKKGLRAQLQLQSLVTGLLEIEFDFYPDTPITLLGTEPNVSELPTIPSDMEKLQMTLSKFIAKFDNLPIDEFVKRLTDIAAGVDRLINSPQTEENVRSFNATLKGLQRLVGNLNNQVNPMSTNIQESFKAAKAALEQAQKTLAAVEGVTGDASSLRYQMGEALEQISDAARSLRVTAEYLDQHPEALIRGKKESGGK